MKAGWKEAALGDVCEIYQPKTIGTKDMSSDAAYPVFGANGVIGKYHLFNHEEPQLLITCRGATCGSVNISEPFSWITGNAMVVRPKVPSLALKYVEFFFRGAVDLAGVITGAAQPQITRQSLAPVRIPFPPLEEQQQIVAVLDEAFEGLARARAHAEANLRDARELFQRSLDIAFVKLSEVAPIKTIGQIADIRGGKRLPQGGELKAEDTGFPYISIKDFMDDGSVNPKTVRFLDADTQEQIKRYIIRSDDLYISIAGTIGKTGIVPPELDGANLTENAARLVFEAGVSNEYVYLFSRTTDFQDQAGLNTRTAAQPKLALSRLSTITLPLAEPQQQADLISRMTAIREVTATLAATYSDKNNRIEALRQSLLQKAFAGELT